MLTPFNINIKLYLDEKNSNGRFGKSVPKHTRRN